MKHQWPVKNTIQGPIPPDVGGCRICWECDLPNEHDDRCDCYCYESPGLA